MSPRELSFVYQGWDGYNQSLASAVAPLTPEQLAFKGAADMRSVGELIWHIARGRVDWFQRIEAPGSKELDEAMADPPACFVADELAEWLQRTWKMVEDTLAQWTVDDLRVTFRHEYWGTAYAVSRQWVIWRILLHDVHHGGQLSELLAMQGIYPDQLTGLGGHLTVPEIASEP